MKRTTWLGLFLSCAMLALPSSLRAQQTPPAEPAPFTLQVTSREVVLDVVVHDSKGHPVSGLKADDFTVTEDGAPQTVRAVTEHVPQPTVPASTLDPRQAPNVFRNISLPATANSNAVTVILIDALETPTTAQMYVRQQLMSFFRKMPPGYVFAIFQLDTRLHLIQGFSADPTTLYAAVESKREMPALPPDLDTNQRKQMLDDALHLMGRYLEAFPGRKNIVWFTSAVPGKISGLKDNPFPDAIDFDQRSGRPANAQSLSRVAVYPIDGKGLSVFSGFGASQEDMDKAADRTGGQAYHNTNGLDRALTEITETSSDYYTLAYAPTDTAFNAHNRKVEITVKGRKLTVLYRHNYYGHKGHPRQISKRIAAPEAYVPDKASAPAAATAGGAEPVTRPAFNVAMELGSVPAGELLFQVSIKPDPAVTRLLPDEALPPKNFLAADYVGRPFRNYQLQYTVDPEKIEFSSSPDGRRRTELVYAVVVYTQEGEIVNSLVTQTSVNLDPRMYAELTPASQVVGATQEIAIPSKGIYFLRMAVQDLTGNLIGSMEVPLDAIAMDATPHK
jgi:VWFA-related protein